MIVAGWTVPSGSNTCVMPSLRPMIPVTMSASSVGDWRTWGLGDSAVALSPAVALRLRPSPLVPESLLVFLTERLDLDVDAGRQIQLHQRVHGLRRGLEDVDQPLVRADLELLARLLVDVRRPQHRPLVFRGRQRNRPRQTRARALRGVDDFAGRLVEHAVVVRLEADSNFVAE